jgi:spermidine synthase
MPAFLARRAFAFGLAASALAAPALAQPPRRRQAAGLIERRESQYNTIYVTRGEDGVISMVFGINQQLFTESEYDPARPRELPVVYTRYMTVGLAYTPQARSILEIGLGGGRTAFYLHQNMPATIITCVELDPEVIALAQRHFDIVQDQRFRLVQRDGRIYLNQNQTRHDLILVDAYRGTFVPFHLLTREFFMICKRRLQLGGVLVQNIEPSTMLYPAAIATLKSVFANVDTYQARGNIVAVAYDGAPKTAAQLRTRADALQRAHRFPHPLPGLLSLRRPAQAERAQILTDDFAPVESLRAIERHNQRQ